MPKNIAPFFTLTTKSDVILDIWWGNICNVKFEREDTMELLIVKNTNDVERYKTISAF